MNVTGILEGSSSPAPRHKPNRRRTAAAGALTLAAAGAVAWFGLKGSGGSADEAARLADRTEARKTLAAFLAAKTPESRAAQVIGGEKLLPLMQAWYAAHENEALSADAFQEPGWTFSTPSADLTALEFPRERGLPPVVACFKRSDAGTWQMDWEIWTQTLDGQFRNFINRPAEGEHTLRARLSRSHNDKGMTVTVADPFDRGQTMTFDVTREDLQTLYKRDLPDAGSRMATVQLVWLNDALSGTLSPALRRHVCWGFPGLDGREAETLVINMKSKNRPPAGTPAVPTAVLAKAPEIDAAVKTAINSPSSGALLRGVELKGDAVQTAKQ